MVRKQNGNLYPSLSSSFFSHYHLIMFIHHQVDRLPDDEKKSTPSPSETTATYGVPPEEKHVKSEEGTRKPFVPNRKNIKTVQGLLLNAGYNPGPLDGLWGSKTGGAVRDFQRDHGLPFTGEMDNRTWGKLEQYSRKPVPVSN